MSGAGGCALVSQVVLGLLMNPRPKVCVLQPVPIGLSVGCEVYQHPEAAIESDSAKSKDAIFM